MVDEEKGPWQAPPMPLDRPLQSLDFVAVDLETTGLSIGFDRITEIGAARFRLLPGGAVAAGPVFEQLVDPGRPIPARVTEITGIDDAMVVGAPPLGEALPTFFGFVGADPSTMFVAHNARFDLGFLVAGAHRADLAWSPPDTLCTVKVARRALPGAPSFGLASLVRWLQGGVATTTTHHRALADALHARRVLAEAVTRTEATTLRELGLRCLTERPEPTDFDLEVPPRFEALTHAILAQRQVGLSYRGGSKGKATRPVTPLAFFARERVLYLHAWCHLDDLAKSFRCDRIRGFSLD